jgi:predicted RNase H-like HicB family nuclease
LSAATEAGASRAAGVGCAEAGAVVWLKRSKEEREGGTMKQIKIIVEKHSDGYVAYPLGVKGVVVGEGGTYEEALADVNSAIRFHVETFGEEVLDVESPVLDAYVVETGVSI